MVKFTEDSAGSEGGESGYYLIWPQKGFPESKMAARVKQSARSQRSYVKIRDCEQSISLFIRVSFIEPEALLL